MTSESQALAFVNALAGVSLPNVFNPYAEVCPFSDRSNAPMIRSRNLKRALSSAIEIGVASVWIAQDLGYRGGRRTGLALTDEAHLAEHGHMLSTEPFLKATRGPALAERTANVVWHALRNINQPILLWNVFPLHPHQFSEPLSNRCHSRFERAIGLKFLSRLLDIVNPELVVTIGLQAESALRQIHVRSERARHPSYGGQKSFLASMSELYGCPIDTSIVPRGKAHINE